jgi:hypothetical protein
LPLLDIDSTSVLVISGEPVEMGRQYGELFAGPIRQALTYLRTHSALNLETAYAALVEHAQRFEDRIPERFLQEMLGIAQGAGVEYADLLLHNCIIDIEACHDALSHHCHNVVLLPETCGTPQFIHGRNLDFNDTIWPIGIEIVVVRIPSDQSLTPTASVFGAGHLGILTGMSRRGISMGEVGSFSQDCAPIGVPIPILLRDALERANDLKEFEEIVRGSERTGGYNVALCHATAQKACAIEFTRNTLDTRGTFRGYLVVDDVCLSRTMQRHRVCLPAAAFRHARMISLLQAHRGAIDVPRVIEFLRDRTDLAYGTDKGRLTNSICNKLTIHSAVMLPAEAKMHVAFGPAPAPLNAYVEIDLAPLWGVETPNAGTISSSGKMGQL